MHRALVFCDMFACCAICLIKLVLVVLPSWLSLSFALSFDLSFIVWALFVFIDCCIRLFSVRMRYVRT